jgi:hypothetical protein
MAVVNTLKIFELLKEKIPEPEAKIITEAIEKSFEEAKEVLATKEDIRKLEEDMRKLEIRLIKWMFAFWAGTILTILLTFFK